MKWFVLLTDGTSFLMVCCVQEGDHLIFITPFVLCVGVCVSHLSIYNPMRRLSKSRPTQTSIVPLQSALVDVHYRNGSTRTYAANGCAHGSNLV